MKKFSLVVLGLASVLAFTGCNSGISSSTNTSQASSVASVKWNDDFTKTSVTSVSTEGLSFVNEGKLTVAMSTDFAPYEFIDLTKSGQDKYVGADVCLAQAIANAMGLELYIKPMDFAVTLTALDSGIADIAISGFSYNATRAASYLFTNCYYSEGDGGQVVLINKKDADKYTTLESLNNANVKIAAQNGALQTELVQNQIPNATLVSVDDLNSEYDVLAAGSIDAIAIAENVANALVAKSPDSYAIVAEHFEYEDNGEYALVKKTNTALKTAVDKVIDEIFASKVYVTWVEEANKLFAGLGDKAGETIPEEE